MNSTFKKLFTHSLHYFVGNFLMRLASFISILIFTRIFSREEYGIMSVVTITVSILSVVALCGFPQSAVRFYHRFTRKRENIVSYYSTLLFGSAMSSFSAVILFLILSLFLSQFLDSLTILLLRIGVLTIVPLNLITTILGFYRASQKTKAYNMIRVARLYGELCLALLLIIIFGMGLSGRFWGSLIANTVLCSILLVVLWKSLETKNLKERISISFLKEAILYGYSFIFLALLSWLLSAGDRYIIQYFKGASAVGIYSVGYSISTMIQSLIVSPINIAILPILLETWNERGEKETKKFLSNLLKYYLLVGIPLIFGVSALAKDLVVIFATSKFSEASDIMPFVIAGVIIYGIYFITWAGLQISKKMHLITYCLLIAVIVNIVLNFLLIPQYDIVGAAIATLVAYIVFFIIATYKSFQYLSFSINLISTSKFVLSSLFMYFCLQYVPLRISLITLIIKIVIGVSIYISFLSLIDKESRDLVKNIFYLTKQKIK